MSDHTAGISTGGASCADCGATATVWLVDVDNVDEEVPLCRRCLRVRYSVDLGHHRQVER